MHLAEFHRCIGTDFVWHTAGEVLPGCSLGPGSLRSGLGSSPGGKRRIGLRSRSIRATGLPNLNGRTLHVSIRTEHAAVAIERMKQGLATGALVEIDARVCWHLFGCGRAALRAGDFRRQDDLHGIPRVQAIVPGKATAFQNQRVRWLAAPYRHLSAGRQQCKIDQDRPRCKNLRNDHGRPGVNASRGVPELFGRR